MLRPLELALVANELNEKLVSAFVQKAWAPMRRVLYLELRVPGRSTLLQINAEPEVGRLCVPDSRMTSEQAAGFQKWVRDALIGAQLVAVRCADRIVELQFRSREGDRSLVLDLQHNALLLVSDRRVLAVSTEERPPPVAPGSPFELPEPSADDAPSRLRPDAELLFPFATAAEALLGTRDDQRRIIEVRRRVFGPLKSRRARLLRTLEKVEAEAMRTPLAEEHRRFGELLTQNLARIPRGASELTATEYTEHGAREVIVPLDPKLPPKEQPEAHFKKYRRYSRGAEHARGRLLVLQAELETVEDALAELEALSDEELLSRPVGGASASPKKTVARHAPYRTYFSKSGARIHVGKSAADNDVLTFKVARGFDLWLHARGVPGSHVVIPLERGAEVAQEVLLDAAHLALHHSPRKGERSAEVSYTYARFVRKVKDGAPGQVLYTREKVFLVRLEEDRIRRLLATSG